MVQLIKPKPLKFSNEKIKDEVKSQIPTDPNGIKQYLEIIPSPVGYRMIVRPWSGKSKTKGGLLLSDETQDKIQMTTVVGLVVKMGDLCYQDKEKFPTGPWCKEGEFVVYGRYSGSRFQTKFGEHRILNDDEIIGKINKPEDILQLY